MFWRSLTFTMPCLSEPWHSLSHMYCNGVHLLWWIYLYSNSLVKKIIKTKTPILLALSNLKNFKINIYWYDDHLQVKLQNSCITLKKVYGFSSHKLAPSINGLVTDGNKKLCCRGFILAGFILALFQSTTANKIDSEHTCDETLFLVCKVEKLQLAVNKIEVSSSF